MLVFSIAKHVKKDEGWRLEGSDVVVENWKEGFLRASSDFSN